MSKWFEPLTATERDRVEQACAAVHAHFGSYSRIAAALIEATGQYVSDETIRNYLIEGKIPVHLATTLSELVPDVKLMDLVPWLIPYCAGTRK